VLASAAAELFEEFDSDGGARGRGAGGRGPGAACLLLVPRYTSPYVMTSWLPLGRPVAHLPQYGRLSEGEVTVRACGLYTDAQTQQVSVFTASNAG